ncbi:EscT/YscT/HrcT family type III secretion system export apparatus protein [Martelella alba]|uniref:EscT/YscT/HrcT family type III secretion system export apparatus protein n=1 Tax=Martelella alba TaxID=2590451 RepID=A0A506U389_9HYPH|nr:type III secretion system export apparatus subunit SctT [Martelella alba]TPW28843.1 EscT/YscT/HrcT family type III secretion system export apparatus protein [Martelella alba]
MSGMQQLNDALGNQSTTIIYCLVLVICRFYAFFALSPFFSKYAMTGFVRMGVIVCVSLLVVPSAYAEAMTMDSSLTIKFAFALKELALGFLLSILTWLPVRGLEMAGVILDTQRGATQSQSFDPIFSEQTTPTSIFLAQVFSGYFFAYGGFLMVLMTVYKSFELWPVLQPFPTIEIDHVLLYLQMAGHVFFSAVVLIAPIAGFMLIADIAIAFLARSAQSLNALTLGMPVKSAILFIVLMFYCGILFPRTMETFSQALDMMSKVFAP